MIEKTRFLAVSHLKGGSGASTVAVNLAAGLALGGRRVVLMDLDPVGASTFHVTEQPPPRDLANALEGRGRLFEVLAETAVPGLLLAAASPALVAWDRRPERFPVDLARVFSEVPEDIDAVIIDTPPSYGAIVRGTLAVLPGGAVLAPVQTRALDLVGFADLVQLIDDLREQNLDLRLAGVVPVRVNRTALSAEVLAALEQQYGERLLPGIRDSTVVARAPLAHKPLQLASPRAKATEDFAALTSAVIHSLFEPKEPLTTCAGLAG